MKLLISGHTSLIAKELIKLINSKIISKVFLVGRDDISDYYCNFAEFSSIKSFINNVINQEHFDYIFLNHGILLGKKALDLDESEVNEYMMVNCFSKIAILEALANQKNTNIVVTSSISSKEGSYDSIYAASKAGLDSFRYRSGKLFDSSVRLNYISPGVIKDALMTTIRKDQNNVMATSRSTPSKELTSSREVAKLVSYLLFNPGNIHCQDIAINGGLSLNR